MALTRREGTGEDSRKRTARPFRILAYDPGGTTGFAWATWAPWNGSEASLEHLSQIEFGYGQIGPHEHHRELWEMLIRWIGQEERRTITNSEYPPLEIVCESFQFRQHIQPNQAKTKVELISCEYIGLLKLFCQMYNVPLTFNTASAAKTFTTDTKIKTLGLWHPGQVHANDATRHLLRYIVVNKKIREPITDKWLQ